MKLNILGTEYTITKKKYKEDETFEREGIDGYCKGYVKQIVFCDMTTYPGYEHDAPKSLAAVERHTLRHEIIHAFLNESGLQDSTSTPFVGWACNEEMIDWFALQLPKVYKVFEVAGCLA